MSNPADRAPSGREAPDALWWRALALLVWLFAVAAIFLPFASDTSPWDAVTFRVPGNQGNWWHFLVGLPFFLALPMIWLRLLALRSKPFSSLAGTSEWQRLVVLGLGLGSMIASGALCLIVYSPGIGHLGADPGWLVTMAVLCCVVPEQLWIFARSKGAPAGR